MSKDDEWDVADETFGRLQLNPDYDHLGHICRQWAERAVGLVNAEVAELVLRGVVTDVALTMTRNTVDHKALIDALLGSNADKLQGYKGNV